MRIEGEREYVVGEKGGLRSRKRGGWKGLVVTGQGEAEGRQ